MYGLDQHLDRFLSSAKQARIPAGDGHRFDKEALRKIIVRTVGAAFAEEPSTQERATFFIRYWLSSGRGTMGVGPPPAEDSGGPNFFCLVERHPRDEGGDAGERGVSEVSVSVPVSVSVSVPVPGGGGLNRHRGW